jgi:hypothetical protein
LAERKKTVIGIDTRGWALGIWADPKRGVDPATLTPARRRQVDAMLEAGWLRRDRGRLHLDEGGVRAIAELLPATLPELTPAQEELLRNALRSPTVGDLSFPPTVKLLAYGLVEAVEQRFGGLRLVPTERAKAWSEGRPDSDPVEPGSTRNDQPSGSPCGGTVPVER